MNVRDSRVYWVYSTVPHKGETDLTKIGLAFPHPDGDGFSVVLDALPFSTKLIVRQPPKQWERESRERSLAQQVAAFERAVIEQCLIESGGHLTAVMDRLNLPRRTLSEKMTRLGIDRHRLAMFVEADMPPVNRQRKPRRAHKARHEGQGRSGEQNEAATSHRPHGHGFPGDRPPPDRNKHVRRLRKDDVEIEPYAEPAAEEAT